MYHTHSAAPAPKTVLVDLAGLEAVRARPTLVNYVRQLLQRRRFIVADGRAGAYKASRDYRLGKVWVIVNPLLDAALYGVIFGVILQTTRGIDNFIGFLILGVTFIGFLTGMLNAGNGLIRASRGMIASFSFPRAALVFSQSVKCTIDYIPPAIIAILIAILAQIDKPVSGTLPLIIPVFLLIIIFGTGLIFLCALGTALFPDLGALIRIASRAWIYSSGVFFSIDRFVSHPALHAVMTYNPGNIYLTAVRDVVLYNRVPSLGDWYFMVAWAIGTFSVGFLYFWLCEERYESVK